MVVRIEDMSNVDVLFDWDKAVDTLTNICQILDGWHNDGTAWSEWDEQVRKEVSDLLRKCIKRSSHPL